MPARADLADGSGRAMTAGASRPPGGSMVGGDDADLGPPPSRTRRPSGRPRRRWSWRWSCAARSGSPGTRGSPPTGRPL